MKARFEEKRKKEEKNGAKNPKGDFSMTREEFDTQPASPTHTDRHDHVMMLGGSMLTARDLPHKLPHKRSKKDPPA